MPKVVICKHCGIEFETIYDLESSELEVMIAEVGFDEEGREIAFFETKDVLVGGTVTAELVDDEWHATIDAGDDVRGQATHESRIGAVYLALGKFVGITAQINRLEVQR